MAAIHDGTTNGINGHADAPQRPVRFAHVPRAVSVTVADVDGPIDVEISLDEDIQDDPTELCTLLENEEAAKSMWMVVALGYAKQHKTDVAIEVLTKALGALNRGRPEDKLSLLNALCWLYLLKCREAPRVRPEGHLAADAKTKEFYIQSATGILNDASRISPSYPPLFLARGVLYLLRASLQTSARAGSGAQANAERVDMLRQAAKCFEDALRASSGRNIMALLGKARVHYSLGKYADALQTYQTVLERAPDLLQPDPRIGIGCCFWMLGHQEDAKIAWERALELNATSKIANTLLALYHLHVSSQYPTTDPKFQTHFKKAMSEYALKAFKLDDKLPLACSTFGGFFLARRNFENVEKLARRAIELTDVNAVASEGWYLLARKEHYNGDLAKAGEYYLRADQARGGDERGYIPAKFGAAQIRVLMNDFEGAKFRLEKILQQSKSIEAMTLLGTLYAEEVFAAQAANSKEDKSNELKKAISLLESVRMAWKDPKKRLTPESSVLLNLARLYESDHPEKSLQCLQQVEQIGLDEIPEEERPTDIEDPEALKAALREFLPPSLLNNIACFHFQAEKYSEARGLFQKALNACVKIGDEDPSTDTDALVTTISYNLGRTYEAEGMPDDAKMLYNGLLERHPDYTDAHTRLTYTMLRQNPTDEGPKAMSELYKSEPSNMEVRSLYGWFLSKAKKRAVDPKEDPEQKHHKHTLINFDKHDRYALTGMGNIWLAFAREMRRDTEQDVEKRRANYMKAVEFFDKALQLDPRNAYAAQGIGIAIAELKKDWATAIQIFSKVKETIKDSSVHINLGHAYCEQKQYTRAIENYEAALAKDRARDPQILACLGRVWLSKGRTENSLEAMKTSLEYSRRALEVAPDQIHFKFNVAFIQNQIASIIQRIPESQRTLEDVETVAKDLEEAIETFTEIAKAPNPPYPRNDIEQRANMAKNTQRKQLERAIASQREYEEKNYEKLRQARELREAELKKREEEKRKAEEAAAEHRRKIAEERRKQEERDRELQEKRAEEEKRRQEFIEENEARKKSRKSGGGKRKKKGDDSEIETDDSDSDAGRGSRQRSRVASETPGRSGDDRPRQKKKRKLERKGKNAGKFKSDEMIVDSDSEGNAEANGDAGKANETGDEGSDAEAVSRPRKSQRVIDEDEDEEEDMAKDENEGNDQSMVDAVPTENGAGASDDE